MNKKILVVCYSFSNGNTRNIAKQLQKALKADYKEIDTIVPYPTYGGFESEVVSQGLEEVKRRYKPEIKPLDLNVNDYDIIAIGTPTWWYTMAPPVLTFLNSYDLKDKTIIPFMTHGGWPGHVINDIKKICKSSSITSSLEVQFDSKGGSKMLTPSSEITTWINKVKEELEVL